MIVNDKIDQYPHTTIHLKNTFFLLFFFRTTQQNKIPFIVEQHCFTHASNRPKKERKKETATS